MKRWSERGDALSGPFMRNTFPIDQHRLQKLFPDATLIKERVLGFEKSIYAFRAPVTQ